MKRILLMCVGAISLLTSCNANEGNKNTNTETDKTYASKETDKKMKTINLTRADFLKKVADFESTPAEFKYLGDKPALIDFYADWCGPCKAIAPVLEELAAEYGDQIYIYKINTENEQELAAMFGIRSIPSLLFVPMDGQPQMAQGALPKDELKKAIEEVLLKKE